jgi:hypothetical protein
LSEKKAARNATASYFRGEATLHPGESDEVDLDGTATLDRDSQIEPAVALDELTHSMDFYRQRKAK